MSTGKPVDAHSNAGPRQHITARPKKERRAQAGCFPRRVQGKHVIRSYFPDSESKMKIHILLLKKIWINFSLMSGSRTAEVCAISKLKRAVDPVLLPAIKSRDDLTTFTNPGRAISPCDGVFTRMYCCRQSPRQTADELQTNTVYRYLIWGKCARATKYFDLNRSLE